MEQLVINYGYLAIIIGTFLEGETIVVLGGFAAEQGYLQLHWVMLAAFVGSLTSDQLFFMFGRTKGQSFIAKRPKWQGKVAKATRLLEKYQNLLILIFRFLYGLRNVIPLAIGLSNVSAKKFLLLNIIGAAVWAASLSTAGFLLGSAVETALEHFKEYQIYIMSGIVVFGAFMWFLRWALRRWKRSPAQQARKAVAQAHKATQGEVVALHRQSATGKKERPKTTRLIAEVFLDDEPSLLVAQKQREAQAAAARKRSENRDDDEEPTPDDSPVEDGTHHSQDGASSPPRRAVGGRS